MKMKKLLFITYDFPPACTSGIYRPVKFVKHLWEFGWEPIVLTARNPYVDALDHTLLKDIPDGTKINRAYSIDLTEINDKIYNLLFGKPAASISKAPSVDNDVSNYRSEERISIKTWIKNNILSKLNRFVENWLYLPDSKVGWYPFALFKAIRIIMNEKPDVVCTTSAPPTTQFVGLTLKFLFRKPWLVDLRDNWVVGYPNAYSSKYRRRLDLWLMRRFVRKADQIVTMCEGNIDDLVGQFPEIDRSKCQCITNGFDADDFIDCKIQSSHNPASKFTILHMGTLYAGTAGKFFQALADLKSEHPEISKSFEINFIGYVPHSYKGEINALNLTDIVHLLGFREHTLAISNMMSADILLLLLGPQTITNQQFPGKVFEYLKAGQLIFIVGREGEVSNAIVECKSGILVPFNQVDRIKSNLYELYLAKMENKLRISPDFNCINKYEYRNLTERFAHVLDKTKTQCSPQKEIKSGARH